mmetsp:Transcript_129762/g.361500  ORF Transcript_129762/g.361500 Transcript_129762/m.361500 type:complete len:210 (-) Transcript_129762:196-825(-)
MVPSRASCTTSHVPYRSCEPQGPAKQRSAEGASGVMHNLAARDLPKGAPRTGSTPRKATGSRPCPPLSVHWLKQLSNTVPPPSQKRARLPCSWAESGTRALVVCTTNRSACTKAASDSSSMAMNCTLKSAAAAALAAVWPSHSQKLPSPQRAKLKDTTVSGGRTPRHATHKHLRQLPRRLTQKRRRQRLQGGPASMRYFLELEEQLDAL